MYTLEVSISVIQSHILKKNLQFRLLECFGICPFGFCRCDIFQFLFPLLPLYSLFIFFIFSSLPVSGLVSSPTPTFFILFFICCIGCCPPSTISCEYYCLIQSTCGGNNNKRKIKQENPRTLCFTVSFDHHGLSKALVVSSQPPNTTPQLCSFCQMASLSGNVQMLLAEKNVPLVSLYFVVHRHILF